MIYRSMYRGRILLFCLLMLWADTNISFAQTPKEEQALFDQADRLFQSGQQMEAIQTLELFWVNYPKSPLLPDILVKLGDILVAQGDFKKAVESYQAYIKLFPSGPHLSSIRPALSRAYLQMGDVEKALGVWSGITGHEIEKRPIYRRAAEIYTEREDSINAVRVLIQNGQFEEEDKVQSNRETIRTLIQDRLSETDLEKVVSEFIPHFPADEALLQLIRRYDDKEVYHRAERKIKQFIATFADHTDMEEVRTIRDTMREKIKKSPYRIAALLPLSGALASFGESALSGIQLALHEFKEALPGIPITLVVNDDNDFSNTGQKALKDWITEYKPIGVVGPLRSQDVNAFAPLANQSDLAVITPGASAATLVLQGETVFRNAATPVSQCHDLVEYAVNVLKIERVALLVPEGEMGKIWVACMTEEMKRLKGTVAVVKSYSSHAADFKVPILHLKNVFRKPAGTSPHGFDALVLPGDAKRVGLIIPQLAFHDLKDVTLLGPMGWNNPAFLKLVGSYPGKVVSIDGFFADSSDALVHYFVQSYQKKFKQDPDLFAAQAYDATYLILDAVKKGALTPSAVRQAVATTTGFPAVSGYIYEMQNGNALKKPFILQMQQERFVQVNAD